jgi:putative ABC transport system substrate-binding protein
MLSMSVQPYQNIRFAAKVSPVILGADMRRREFLGVLGSAAAWPMAGRAQTPGRTYRIGYLTGASRRQATLLVALLDELRLAGFIEGQNLTVLDGGFGVMNNEAPAAIAALVKASPDAIFTPGFVLAKAAQTATKTIPIVAMSEDMVAEGLVSSLARPDGNTTGISLISPDLDGKRGDLLLEAVPGLHHVAVLADPSVDTPSHLQDLKDSAKARGIELSVFSARTPQEIVPALDAAKSSGARAINVLATSLFFFNRRMVIERANELRLPAVYQWPEMAEEGGLIGYGPRFTEVGRLLGRQLVKILRRANPGAIPVEQPSRFELVINLQTAKAIGLEIPPNFVLHADKLIE